MRTGWLRVARSGSAAQAPPLATRRNVGGVCRIPVTLGGVWASPRPKHRVEQREHRVEQRGGKNENFEVGMNVRKSGYATSTQYSQ